MHDSATRAPTSARPPRSSSACDPIGRRLAPLTIPLLAIAFALPTSQALAQSAGGRLGNPVTGEAATTVDGEVIVPPPPSYVSQGELSPEEFGEDANAPLPEIQSRLRVLDSTWQSLALTGGPNWMNFVVALIGGGIQIGLGAWMATQGPPADTFAPMLISLGAIGLISPVLRLILRPDASGPALRYQAMPDSTPAETLARLHYGEQQLESYANAFFVMRMIDASVNVGAAVAVAAITVAAFDSLIDFSQPYTYFLFIGPLISLINGIIEFATPSPAEQRWALYVQMRDQLRARRRAGEDVSELDLVVPSFAEPSVSFGAAPAPNGGYGVVTGRF